MIFVHCLYVSSTRVQFAKISDEFQRFKPTFVLGWQQLAGVWMSVPVLYAVLALYSQDQRSFARTTSIKLHTG
jgi:hypothetical protein